MAECSIADCERPAAKRGWCFMHYTRWHVHGDPNVVKSPPGRPPLTVEGFWAKVDKTDGCWLWTAACNPEGYGRVQWNGRNQPAHRVAYELVIETPPADLDLDHLCRVRACARSTSSRSRAPKTSGVASARRSHESATRPAALR